MEYDAIAKNCRQFAIDLLELCRSTEEIETLLNVVTEEEGDFKCPSNVPFQRVILAVSYSQKEVRRRADVNVFKCINLF